MDIKGEPVTYTAPPIVEAIVEIIVTNPFGESEYRKIRHKIANLYENKTEIKIQSGTMDIVKETASFHSELVSNFSSYDETSAMQIHKNKFVWSSRAPYKGWNNFFDFISRDFGIIIKNCGPLKLSRIGMRYINRFDIPDDYEYSEPKHFLNIFISKPGIFQNENSYQFGFEEEFRDLGLKAIIQSAKANPEIPHTTAFIFDIDVVCDRDLPIKSRDIFDKILVMRDLKNQIFESCITDQARELFGK